MGELNSQSRNNPFMISDDLPSKSRLTIGLHGSRQIRREKRPTVSDGLEALAADQGGADARWQRRARLGGVPEGDGVRWTAGRPNGVAQRAQQDAAEAVVGLE